MGFLDNIKQQLKTKPKAIKGKSSSEVDATAPKASGTSSTTTDNEPKSS